MHEVAKFLPDGALRPLAYQGPPAVRAPCSVRGRSPFWLLPTNGIPHLLHVTSSFRCSAMASPAANHNEMYLLQDPASVPERLVLHMQARAALQKRARTSDLVVMSYETLRADVAWAAGRPWLYAVLDEGHIIRNPKSKIAQARGRFTVA